MNTTMVIQKTGFRILGPAGAELGPFPHGELTMIFNTNEPAQVDLLFHQKGMEEPTRWCVSRELFCQAVRHDTKPITEGDFQCWGTPDRRGLVMRLTDQRSLCIVETLKAMVFYFVEQVDAACPPGSAQEQEAMAALIDETLALLLDRPLDFGPDAC